MFFRVPKRWEHCGKRLDSAGRNFYLKAKMSAHLSLNRFVVGVNPIWGWLVFSLFSYLTHIVHLPPNSGPFRLQKVDYTLGEESEVPGQRSLSSEELSRQLEKLLKEGSSNQRVFDWIEVCFSWVLGEREIKER